MLQEQAWPSQPCIHTLLNSSYAVICLAVCSITVWFASMVAAVNQWVHLALICGAVTTLQALSPSVDLHCQPESIQLSYARTSAT